MKFKGTWLLLGLFAALGAYLVFVDEPARRAGQRADDEKGSVFPGFDPAKVAEFALEGAKGRIRLAKSGGKWSVTEPIADAADEGRIQSLLEDLKGLKADREVAPTGADPKPFGLDAPELILRTRGSVAALEVGGETPAGDGRYVRQGTGAVKVAGNDALLGLLVEPKDLRAKNVLLAFPWSRLESVEVTAKGRPTLRLRKAGEHWALESPVVGEADPEAAQTLAEKLRWAKASAFPDEPSASAGLRMAKGFTVAFTATGQPKPATVRLAAVGDEVWADSSERAAILSLPREVLAAFEGEAGDLLRRRPVLATTWGVEKIEVSGGGRSFAYDKPEGSWKRGGKPLPPAETASLETLLKALEQTKADHVIRAPKADADYGLASPRAVLQIADSRYGRQTLVLGAKGKEAFARAGREGPVYAVPADFLAKAEALLANAPAPP